MNINGKNYNIKADTVTDFVIKSLAFWHMLNKYPDSLILSEKLALRLINFEINQHDTNFNKPSSHLDIIGSKYFGLTIYVDTLASDEFIRVCKLNDNKQ